MKMKKLLTVSILAASAAITTSCVTLNFEDDYAYKDRPVLTDQEMLKCRAEGFAANPINIEDNNNWLWDCYRSLNNLQ